MKKYIIIGVNRLYEVKENIILEDTTKENIIKRIEKSFDLSLYYTIKEVEKFKD